MRLGRDTASAANWALSGPGQPEPEVGMGATVLAWTDRHAGTVAWVSESGRRLLVREDRATRTDGGGMSERQAYAYEPDPAGRTWEFRLRKDGTWRGPGRRGPGLRLGEREKYHDFNF